MAVEKPVPGWKQRFRRTTQRCGGRETETPAASASPSVGWGVRNDRKWKEQTSTGNFAGRCAIYGYPISKVFLDMSETDQTRIIDGKAIAATVREELSAEVQKRKAQGLRAPGLATVLVGDDPASHVYVRNKRKQCAAVGI